MLIKSKEGNTMTNIIDRKYKIIQIDALYREIEDIDEQYLIISKVLNFLTNDQLHEITKNIKLQIKLQKKELN